MAQRERQAPASRSLRADTIHHYLETVYYIHHEGERVRPSRLAEWMGVSPATVSTTLRSLADHGWIRVAEDRSVTLTAKGTREAEAIVRAHRLVERWLTDRLGLDWAAADEGAQQLAPSFTPELADRLDDHLGHPETCPHGNVIPGRAAPYGRLVSLPSLAPGTTATVRRISEVAEHDAPSLLRLLDEHGMLVGRRVVLEQPTGAAGALAVRVDKHSVAIGSDVAGAIWVEPVDGATS